MKLSTAVRASILRSLCEGNSIAITLRMLGVSERAAMALLVQAGEACAAYMDKHFVNLPCTELHSI